VAAAENLLEQTPASFSLFQREHPLRHRAPSVLSYRAASRDCERAHDGGSDPDEPPASACAARRYANPSACLALQGRTLVVGLPAL
jgi:hypothetical protein